MTLPPARNAQQRKQDVLKRLENDVDVWIATADRDGNAYLVPLSFMWDGEDLILATTATSPTGRNLGASRRARIGLGVTRDVVMIEGTVAEPIPATEVSEELADAFAAQSEFDPREDTASPYQYFRIHPQRVQAWREVNELKGRELMRDGRWLV